MVVCSVFEKEKILYIILLINSEDLIVVDTFNLIHVISNVISKQCSHDISSQTLSLESILRYLTFG